MNICQFFYEGLKTNQAGSKLEKFLFFYEFESGKDFFKIVNFCWFEVVLRTLLRLQYLNLRVNGSSFAFTDCKKPCSATEKPKYDGGDFATIFIYLGPAGYFCSYTFSFLSIMYIIPFGETFAL